MESYLGWFLLHLLVVCVCVSCELRWFSKSSHVFALVKHHHSSWVALSKVGKLMEGLMFYLATSGHPGKLAFAEELARLANNMVVVIEHAQRRNLTNGKPYDVEAFDKAVSLLHAQYQQLQQPPHTEQPEGPSASEVPLPNFLLI